MNWYHTIFGLIFSAVFYYLLMLIPLKWKPKIKRNVLLIVSVILGVTLGWWLEDMIKAC